MDAFSRRIFHQCAFLRETKEAVVKVTKVSLQEARELGIKVTSLVRDHGRVYKAKDTREHLREEGVLPIFAPPYWPEGKAALERYFRTLKEAVYVRPGKLIQLLLRGLIRKITRLGKRIIAWILNIILQTIQEEYNGRPQGKEKESPDERISKEHSEELEAATRRVLEQRMEKSSLKGELIDSLIKEFELTVSRVKAKNYLSRYRKESIEEAAEALRRKQAEEELPPLNCWRYLAAVARKTEKRKEEVELKEAKSIIYREKERMRKEQERKKIQRQREWLESHPEESLQEAIEWYLLFHRNKLGLAHYERMIMENVVKIMKRHSLLTVPIKIQKMGESILSEDTLNGMRNKAEKKGLELPNELKIDEAKTKILELIQGSYAEAEGNLPPIQNLGSLYPR